MASLRRFLFLNDDFMDTESTDYKSDLNLQTLDNKLTAGANDVMNMTSGIDCLNQSVLLLRTSHKQGLETIMSFKEQILTTKGHAKTKIERFLDNYLIMQFLENSNQTLKLCKLELSDFIGKANKVISCIMNLEREGGNRLKLNKAKENLHHSAKATVEKVKKLREQHLNLLSELKEEFKKLDKELKCTLIFKKVAHAISTGILYGLFACGVIAAVLAIPGVAPAIISHPGVVAFLAVSSIAQTSSSAIKAGQQRLRTKIDDSESTLRASQQLVASMESGTIDAILVLDDIMSHVNKVIASGNYQQLLANDGPVVQFKKEIEELDKTTKACIPVIEEARNKVVEDYKSLMEKLTAQSKKK